MLSNTGKDTDVSQGSDRILSGPLAHLWSWSCRPSPSDLHSQGRKGHDVIYFTGSKKTVRHQLAHCAATLCTLCMGQAAVEKNFVVGSILSQEHSSISALVENDSSCPQVAHRCVFPGCHSIYIFNSKLIVVPLFPFISFSDISSDS